MANKLLRNWPLKLLALALALALWSHVVGQDKVEVNLRVPVVVTNLPPGLVLVGDVPADVEVRVYGSRSLIRQAGEDGRLAKIISLAGRGAGEYEVLVVPEELKLPYGLRVSRVSPSRFTLRLAHRAEREVPVRPVLRDQPAAGLEVAEVSFRPDRVRIVGIEDDLKAVDWVWTVPISVNALKHDTTLRVSLRLPEERPLVLDPATVEATIRLKPTTVAPAAPAAPAAKPPAPPAPGILNQTD